MRDAPAKLVYLAIHGERKKPEEEVVVLSQVLASKATLGYENLCNVRVRPSPSTNTATGNAHKLWHSQQALEDLIDYCKASRLIGILPFWGYLPLKD